MHNDIKKYEFKTELPIEFEILRLSELYKNEKSALTTPHRTNFYHILWLQKGNPTHLIDFQPVKIKPNTILFLNKNIVHRFDDKENYDGFAITFTDNFFCKTKADTKFLRSSFLFNDMFGVVQIQLSKKSILFTDLLQLMTLEFQNEKDNYHSDILQNLLHNFLLFAERERRKQKIEKIKKSVELDYVLLFKDLLEKEYKNKKQVKFYASQILITEKRLNQATTKIMGRTPKQIIDERVLLEAKRLLAHTNDSIKEIGFELGFKEPTNFIKYFRKHSNLTPVKFREQFS